jgi:Flp pilus assembly pilin Flp
MHATDLANAITWARHSVTSRIRRDQTGASLVEYALLLALIVVVAIAAVIVIGNVTSNSINNAASNLP